MMTAHWLFNMEKDPRFVVGSKVIRNTAAINTIRRGLLTTSDINSCKQIKQKMNLIKIILAYSEINNKANPPANTPIFIILNFLKWKLRSMNKFSNFSCGKNGRRGSWVFIFHPQEPNIYESS